DAFELQFFSTAAEDAFVPGRFAQEERYCSCASDRFCRGCWGRDERHDAGGGTERDVEWRWSDRPIASSQTDHFQRVRADCAREYGFSRNLYRWVYFGDCTRAGDTTGFPFCFKFVFHFLR